MPRKGPVSRREIEPDLKYHDRLVTKAIVSIMRKGKKNIAEGIFYGAMDVIREKTKDDPLKVYKKAMDNVKPILETRSRRVGGATYQVPVEVRPERKLSLALRWIIGFAMNRGEKTMMEKLAGEILDAAEGKGASIKKREDTHKMAEANRAFAHYRW